MACQVIKLGNATGIVCGMKRPAPCKYCRQPHARLCDGKLASGKTCDVKLCEACTRSPAPEKDLCPPHWRQWQERLAKRALTTAG